MRVRKRFRGRTLHNKQRRLCCAQMPVRHMHWWHRELYLQMQRRLFWLLLRHNEPDSVAIVKRSKTARLQNKTKHRLSNKRLHKRRPMLQNAHRRQTRKRKQMQMPTRLYWRQMWNTWNGRLPIWGLVLGIRIAWSWIRAQFELEHNDRGRVRNSVISWLQSQAAHGRWAV